MKKKENKKREKKKIYKYFTYRIYPTKIQEEKINNTLGCCRFVYNYFLAESNEDFKKYKMYYDYVYYSRELTELKREAEYYFLNNVNSSALQNELKKISQAIKNHVTNPKNFNMPVFKKKHSSKQSYLIYNGQNTIRFEQNKLKLPSLGLVKIKKHRELFENSRIINVSVLKKKSNKFFVVLCISYENQVRENKINNGIGLDFSLKKLYVDNNGNSPKYFKSFQNNQKILQKEDKKLARMKKYSNNYNKQLIKRAKVYEKISNQKRNYLHNISRELVNNFDYICIEDLDLIKISQAYNFGKILYDNGWRIFIEQLEYKLEEQNKKLVKVDRYFPSSRLCSVCSYETFATKDLKTREWICPNCNTKHDRDINAAINILNEGKKILNITV